MVETELKGCGEAKIKMRKMRGYYSCLAYFLVVLLMLSFSFVLIVTALVPCVFFSVADHNGGAKPRVKRWGIVWERERAMPFGPAINGLSVDSGGDVGGVGVGCWQC